MIEHLRGRVVGLDEDSVLLEVGGIGLRLKVPRPAWPASLRGRPVLVHAVLEWRPRGVTGYAFRTRADRDLFEGLRSLRGIGGATALRLVPHLRKAASGRVPVIPQIPGLGPAKRRRIESWIAPAGAPSREDPREHDLRDALRGLGLSAAESRARARRAVATHPGAPLDRLIRAAVGRPR